MISVASRSMTSQPASSFPATASHGNPAGRRRDQRPRVRPDLRPGPGDPVQGGRGRPAPASAAPWYRSARAPSTGAWCASTVMSLMLVAPSAIATAIETSAIPRSTSGNLPSAQRRAQRRGQPAWSASLRSSTVTKECVSKPTDSGYAVM